MSVSYGVHVLDLYIDMQTYSILLWNDLQSSSNTLMISLYNFIDIQYTFTFILHTFVYDPHSEHFSA